jgi:RimJ/RimL family protein N-acetyltransferase
MSTITVPEPIASSFDPADRLRQLRIRIAGRLRLGLRNESTRYGLRRDLAHPFPAPPAKIPISVRPLAEADLSALLAVDDTTSPEDRFEMACRRALAAKRIAGAYVAIDERDGTPCYVQWLFGAADNDFVRRLHGFPKLAADEALLEGAYTPATHRGLGIMPAAMALIAEKADTLGARYVITFVAPDNIPSLKGCQRCGFSPDLVHRLVGFGFGLFRRDSFTKLAADDPRRTQKF